MPPSDRSADHVAGQMTNAARRQRLRQVSIDALTRVDDGCNLDAGIVCRQGRVVCSVVVGEQDHPRPRFDGPTPQISADRTGKHDSRSIIVGEYERTFMGACRKHDLMRSNMPQALANRAAAGAILDPFQCAQIVTVVVAEDRCPRQQANVISVIEFADNGIAPIRSLDAVDLAVGTQKAAAEPVVGICQDDARARTSGRSCSGQTGWACSNHQHIAMMITMIIEVGIRCIRGFAPAGSTTDHRFIDPAP